MDCNSVETTDTDMILFEELQHSVYSVYNIALFQSRNNPTSCNKLILLYSSLRWSAKDTALWNINVILVLDYYPTIVPAELVLAIHVWGIQICPIVPHQAGPVGLVVGEVPAERVVAGEERDSDDDEDYFSSYLTHFKAQEVREGTEENVVGLNKATLLLEG